MVTISESLLKYMRIGYIVQVENDCWVFGVIEYKKYAFQAWKPADFLNCFLCALRLRQSENEKDTRKEITKKKRITRW